MKLNVYSIFDTASGLYSRPFFTQSDPEAMRSFTDIAVDADHPIGKHPEDYSLFRLGTFDDDSGKLNKEDPECLCTALERISFSRSVDARQINTLDKSITHSAELKKSLVGVNQAN